MDNDSDESGKHYPLEKKTPNAASSNSIPTPGRPDEIEPSRPVTVVSAILYVLSGCCQPLLMTLCKEAGLANSHSEIYMLFYYLGPALLMFQLFWDDTTTWPNAKVLWLASAIAFWDIASTSLNYTGASLAGPTIFAIVYSSVTIWTALFSQCFLGRTMQPLQWLGVVTVFGGLCVTAMDSAQLGPDVWHGALLVVAGSSMHALTYVFCEAMMTTVAEPLSVIQNCAIQGLVAFLCFVIWQIIYTAPRFDELIGEPMAEAGTALWYGLTILFGFSLTNMVHAFTFYHTLRHSPGGATSAGVMKGLQAVLVFCLTHWIYCGRVGGQEMCFTQSKFYSLLTVCGGLIVYGAATQQKRNRERNEGYARIEEMEELEDFAPL
jgi:drug/metabolite transporter (DMT)-like permease